MCDCQWKLKSGMCPKMSFCFFVCVCVFLGLKKIRNPERMVRIAVGYTGHAPPKSDDTDANSKRHTNTLQCTCARSSGAPGDSGSRHKSLLAG